MNDQLNEALKLAGLLDGIAAGCLDPDDRPIITREELREWANIIRESHRASLGRLLGEEGQ